MQKDIITKSIIKEIAKDIAVHIFHLPLEAIELFDKEFDRIEQRKADIVAKVVLDGKDAIFHLEIQNDNDKHMPLRMLRYYTDVKFDYQHLPIHQYLLYIGKKPLMMEDQLTDDHLNYHYHLVDAKTIDCELLLNSENPEAVVLSILCDFKGRNDREIIRRILQKIIAATAEDKHRYRKYIKMLEILSTNRNLKQAIIEEEKMLNVDIEAMPSYEIGLERGLERGLEKGEKKMRLAVAKKMLAAQLDTALIMQITGLLKEDIEQLYRESGIGS